MDLDNDIYNPFIRSNSPPTEQHLRNNPIAMNPIIEMLGDQAPNVQFMGDDSHASKFCDIPKINKFGIVTGYNNQWFGKSKEELYNNKNLFTLHVVKDEGLSNSSFILNHKKFSRISFNDFIPITDDIIYDFNFQCIDNVGLLQRPNVRDKVFKIMATHCVNVKKQNTTLKNELRECKNELQVSYIPVYCHKQNTNNQSIF